MRGSVLTASALVAGGLLAHLILDDPGYVAISIGRSLFETTAPVFLLLLIGLYFLARAVIGSLTARRRLATLRLERRKRRARDDTQRGLLDLAAGRWRSAEELLSRAAPEADSAAANYLVAARAADLQDAIERRDEWLALAQEAAPAERAAALVTLAEMQMRRGQDAAALQTLEQLDASGDLNSRGLELMARLCQKLGRGEQLRALGPRLRSAKELPEAQVNELLGQVQLEEVRAAGEQRDVAAVNAAWSSLPRVTRKLPQAIATHARALIAADAPQGAEKLLRDAIDERPEPVLLRLYGELVLPDSLALLDRAENWLRQSPEDPDLLTACARLALQAELIGKARSYLEASLARKPSAENSLLYADLLDQLGEADRARKVCATRSRARSVADSHCRAYVCGGSRTRARNASVRVAAGDAAIVRVPEGRRATGRRARAPRDGFTACLPVHSGLRRRPRESASRTLRAFALPQRRERIGRVIERVEEQLRARQPALDERVTDRLDHGRRAARVHVVLGKVVQVAERRLVHRADTPGPRSRFLLRFRQDRSIVERRPDRGNLRQPVVLVQVARRACAPVERDRTAITQRKQLAQHGPQRRVTRTAADHH
jgi:HemY protein